MAAFESFGGSGLDPLWGDDVLDETFTLDLDDDDKKEKEFTLDITRPEIPRDPTVLESAERGAKQLYGTLWGMAGLTADWAANIKVADPQTLREFRDYSLTRYQELEKEAGELRGDLPRLTQITLDDGVWAGLGDLAKVALHEVVAQVPMLAATAGGGAAGGKAAQIAGRKYLQQKLKEGIASKIASAYGRTALAGQAVGVQTAVTAIEAGSIYGQTYTEHGEESLNAEIAFGMGAIAAVFDSIPILRGLHVLGVGRRATKNIVREMAKDGLLRTVAREGGLQFVLEGGTEAVQTAIERYAMEWANDNGELLSKARWDKLFSPEAVEEIKESAGIGGLVGAVFGVLTGGFGKIRSLRAARLPETPAGATPPSEAPPPPDVYPGLPTAPEGPAAPTLAERELLIREAAAAAEEPARPSDVVTPSEPATEDLAEMSAPVKEAIGRAAERVGAARAADAVREETPVTAPAEPAAAPALPVEEIAPAAPPAPEDRTLDEAITSGAVVRESPRAIPGEDEAARVWYGDELHGSTVYRGYGREEAGAPYAGPAIPIAGDAGYYFFDKADTEPYGPKVEERTLDLENPLVIEDGKDWWDLTRAAGWEFPNPFGLPEDQIQKMVSSLKELVQSRGHDGIIVWWDDSIEGDIGDAGENLKLLREVFDKPQAIDYRGAPAPAAEPAAEEAPSAVKDEEAGEVYGYVREPEITPEVEEEVPAPEGGEGVREARPAEEEIAPKPVVKKRTKDELLKFIAKNRKAVIDAQGRGIRAEKKKAALREELKPSRLKKMQVGPLRDLVASIWGEDALSAEVSVDDQIEAKWRTYRQRMSEEAPSSLSRRVAELGGIQKSDAEELWDANRRVASSRFAIVRSGPGARSLDDMLTRLVDEEGWQIPHRGDRPFANDLTQAILDDLDADPANKIYNPNDISGITNEGVLRYLGILPELNLDEVLGEEYAAVYEKAERRNAAALTDAIIALERNEDYDGFINTIYRITGETRPDEVAAGEGVEEGAQAEAPAAPTRGYEPGEDIDEGPSEPEAEAAEERGAEEPATRERVREEGPARERRKPAAPAEPEEEIDLVADLEQLEKEISAAISDEEIDAAGEKLDQVLRKIRPDLTLENVHAAPDADTATGIADSVDAEVAARLEAQLDKPVEWEKVEGKWVATLPDGAEVHFVKESGTPPWSTWSLVQAYNGFSGTVRELKALVEQTWTKEKAKASALESRVVQRAVDEAIERIDLGVSRPASISIIRSGIKIPFQHRQRIYGTLVQKLHRLMHGRKWNINNQRHRDEAARILAAELRHQRRQVASGEGWYTADVADAFEIMSDNPNWLPELKDPEMRQLFTVVAGVLSVRQEVGQNWYNAIDAFMSFVKEGKRRTFPLKKTHRYPQTKTSRPGANYGVADNAASLNAINLMIKDMGITKMLDWLFSPHTVEEIQRFREKYKKVRKGRGPDNVPWGKKDVYLGVYMFGGKAGPFILGMNNVESTFIVLDNWNTRTIGRLFGDPFVSGSWKLRDLPAVNEREVWSEVIRRASERVGVGVLDGQAISWFFEQGLWKSIGGSVRPVRYYSAATREFEQHAKINTARIILPGEAPRTSMGRPSAKALESRQIRHPIWYSQLLREVENRLPKRGTGKSLAATIRKWGEKGIVKPEEIRWTGLADWLEEQGDKVVYKYAADNPSATGDIDDSVSTYIAAHQIVLDTVVRSRTKEGEPPIELSISFANVRSGEGVLGIDFIDESEPYDTQDWDYPVTGLMTEGMTPEGTVNELLAKAERAFRQGETPPFTSIVLNVIDENSLRTADIVAEVDVVGMVTFWLVPDASFAATRRFIGDQDEISNVHELLVHATAVMGRDQSTDRVNWESWSLYGGDNYHEIFLRLQDDWPEHLKNVYKGHDDIDNVISRIRAKEFTTDDGRRVIYIEEVQSDVAQKARKQGYISEQFARELSEDRTTANKRKDKLFGPVERVAVARQSFINEVAEIVDEVKLKIGDRPSVAPSVHEQQLLAFSQITVREALNRAAQAMNRDPLENEQLQFRLGELGADQDTNFLEFLKRPVTPYLGPEMGYAEEQLFIAAQRYRPETLGVKTARLIQATLADDIQILRVPHGKGGRRHKWILFSEKHRIRTAWHYDPSQALTFGRVEWDTAAADAIRPRPFPDTNKVLLVSLKRMIRWAAENDFDVVAWAPGEIQIERYGLSQAIQRLEVGVDTIAVDMSGNPVVISYDVATHQQTSEGVEEEASFSPSIRTYELAEHVGKAVADDVRNKTAVELKKQEQVAKDERLAKRLSQAATPYSGAELSEAIAELRETGERKRAIQFEYRAKQLGELDRQATGHKKVYNEVFPSGARKYVKQWGATVTREPLAIEKQPGEKIKTTAKPTTAASSQKRQLNMAREGSWQINVNEAMRQAALDGQPMFSKPVHVPTSRTQGVVRRTQPHQVRMVLEERLGEEGATRLLEERISVIDSEEDLPIHLKPTALASLRKGGATKAIVDLETGRVYLILRNLSPNEVWGTILHEIGVHVGFRIAFTPEEYDFIVGEMRRMRDAGVREVVEAYMVAERNTKQTEHIDEEAIAYLVEMNPDLTVIGAQAKGFLQRIWQAIRKLWKAITGAKDPLTPEEIVEMARGMVKHLAMNRDLRPLKAAWSRRIDMNSMFAADEPVESPEVPIAMASRQYDARDFTHHSSALDAAVKKVMGTTSRRGTRDEVIGDYMGRIGHALARVADQFRALVELDKLANNGISPTNEKYPAQLSSYIAARMTTSPGTNMLAVLMHGPLKWDRGVPSLDGPGRQGLFEIWKELGDEVDLFLMWMAAHRAERLLTVDKEALFTKADVDIMKRELPRVARTSPIWGRKLAEMQDFNKKMLAFAQEAGIINDATRQIWEKDIYIPFYRVLEPTWDVEKRKLKAPTALKGLANQKAFRRIFGGPERLGDLQTNLILNYSALVNKALKNNASKLAISNALYVTGTQMSAIEAKKGKTYRPIVEAVSLQPEVVEHRVDEIRRAFERHLGWKLPPRARAITDAYEGVTRMVPPTGEDIVSVMIDGKNHYFRVNDTELYASLTAMNQTVLGGHLLNAFRIQKRFFTRMVTSQPIFWVKNLIRDTLHAMVVARRYSRGGRRGLLGHTPIIGALKGIIAQMRSMKTDPVQMEMMASGASFLQGFTYGTDPVQTRNLVDRMMIDHGYGTENVMSSQNRIARFLRKMIHNWEMFGAKFENAVRRQIYNDVMTATNDPLRAAFEAKDIMDFSLHGQTPAILAMTQVIPFFGARIQGLYRGVRVYAEDPVGVALRGFMLTALATAAYAWNMMDDERRKKYDALPDYLKDSYTVFVNAYGEGTVALLVNPFEVGAIHMTLPVRMMEALRQGIGLGGKEADAKLASKILWDRLLHMGSQTFALDYPALVAPMIEVVRNRNLFTGAPIETVGMQSLLPHMRKYPWTSETMQMVGEYMPRVMPDWVQSPRMLESVMRGYTGTVGMFTLAALDHALVAAGKFPERPTRDLSEYYFARWLVQAEPYRHTEYHTIFWDAVRTSNQLQNTYNRLRVDDPMAARELAKEKRHLMRLRGRMTAYQKQMRNINRRVQNIYKSNRPGAVKQQQLDNLLRRANQITERAYQQTREFR